ncbi:hypothetical protein H9P43_000913 [Blastocladiella emersonii ATCC 22665]|nr:hypothetical protein H9P43_000913 [Blastocladiella emersonii ATCC 22665]
MNDATMSDATVAELESLVTGLIQSGASVVSSTLAYDDDDDAVPLDGLWNEALELASHIPAATLPTVPAALIRAASHAAPGVPIAAHFYLLASSLTDLRRAHAVLSLSDLSRIDEMSGPEREVPASLFAPLFPRIMQDIALRAPRWTAALDADVAELDVPAVLLAFAIARSARLAEVPEAQVDDATVRVLLQSLETTSRAQYLEPLNDAVTQLLLAVNEQALAAAGGCDTPLVRALAAQASGAHTFVENLIYVLNRSDDPATQLLVLKPTYILVALHPQLFFTNDLAVLVEVVLRQLRNADAAAPPATRNAFLRVLEALVPAVPATRRDDVHRVAQSVASAYAGIDATSVRLAERILAGGVSA